MTVIVIFNYVKEKGLELEFENVKKSDSISKL